jgi:4-hydroxybenzoate polyprenyltransferase
VHQWVKNLFIFIPSFFAGEFFNIPLLVDLALAFLAFSFVASAVYILNDYVDREKDRVHPAKRWRPIASGVIGGRQALAVGLALFFSATAISLLVLESLAFFSILIGYIILNISYTFLLKEVSLVDVFTIGIGFVLRILAGASLATVALSHWIVMMVFLLAIFLGFSKRYDDLVVDRAKENRLLHKKYNLPFLSTILPILSGIIILAYINYTLSEEVIEKFQTENLYITGLFVMMGIFRYLQIIYMESGFGSPTRILYTDKYVLISLVAWLMSFFIIIYF